MSLRPVPLTIAEANRYVAALHRHNGALPTAKFCVGAVDAATGKVHGVAVAGLPKARAFLDGGTLEVSRVCTEGTDNCCSFLYGCCTRAAKALGYARVVTYTLASESGASLKASGWRRVAELPGRSWGDERHAGARVDDHDNGPKVRWEIALADPVPVLQWPWPDEPEIEQPELWEAA